MTLAPLVFGLIAFDVFLVVAVVALAFRRRHEGLTIFASGYVAGLLGLLYLTGQGVFDPWISVVLANALIIFFNFSIPWGVRAYLGLQPRWPWRFWVYYAAWLLVLVYFTFVQASYVGRAALASITMVLLAAEALQLRRLIPSRLARWGALVFVVFIAGHVVRIVSVVAAPAPLDSVLDTSQVNLYIFGLTQVFTVAWTAVVLVLALKAPAKVLRWRLPDAHWTASRRKALRWTPDWNSGDETIDKQHAALLLLAQEMLDRARKGIEPNDLSALADRFLAALVDHFSDEEQTLADKGYPDAAGHAEAHSEVLAKAFQAKRAAETNGELDALVRLLVDQVMLNHLHDQDHEFHDFLKANPAT